MSNAYPQGHVKLNQKSSLNPFTTLTLMSGFLPFECGISTPFTAIVIPLWWIRFTPNIFFTRVNV